MLTSLQNKIGQKDVAWSCVASVVSYASPHFNLLLNISK
jgi:hypothetical protein